MTHPTKTIATIILTALLTIYTLALAITTASANRLSLVRSERGIKVVWTSLNVTNTVNNATVSCPVTLEGSFHSNTIVKSLNALLGYVTRALLRAEECTGGPVTIHTEKLPWHIRYRSYSGELPDITLIIFWLIGAEFEIHDNSSGNTCNARTEAAHPAVERTTLNAATHRVENLTPERNARIPLTNGAGGIFCGLGEMAGEGVSKTPTSLNSATTFSVTLI